MVSNIYLSCKIKLQTSFPGQIKFVQQDNSSHTDIQSVQISVCHDPGSSCASCEDSGDKVCQQSHRQVRLWVLGDNGKDMVKDEFLLPDGCQCVDQ